MNHAYRLVWSAARRAYVIAPETARGRGKSGGTLMVGALVTLFGLALHGIAQAQQPPAAPNVVPTSAATEAYVAPNGVTVVNISTANGAGVSHNRFHRYDVDPRGLVLNNNGNPNVAAMESQLAGQVYTNTLLGREAGVILNEVVSPNRSILAGFTEVLGKKADVIVANPYGITCTGCGFINTDRATLTTGTPVWKADGRVAGFNVAGGDVLINGGGLNASSQALLDIVTRTVKADGQVNGNDIVLATGAHAWNYATREVTGSMAPSGEKKEYAIDTTALGGMYANRIHMIATEAGVGVRMLGEAAARTDDFRVDAAGQVVLRGALSAGRDLVVRAAQLDAASDQPATRFAKRNIDLGTSGSAAFDGGTWMAGGELGVQSGMLTTAGGVQFYSGTDTTAFSRAMRLGADGAMNLANVKLVSEGGMDLAAGGQLQFGQGANAQAAGDIAIRARGRMDNNGTLIAARGMTAAIDQADGSAAAPVLVNNGLLQASAGVLAIGAPGRSLVVNNSGRLLGSGINLYGDRLANRGWIQSDNNALTVQAGEIDNAQDGVLLGAGKGHALRLYGATLNNDGVVQSAGNIDIATASSARNAGKLITTDSVHGGADGDIAINAHVIDNSGTVDAAGAGRFDAGYSMANAGRVRARGISLTAFELDNQGTIYSRDDLTAGPRKRLMINNRASGQIIANGKLTIDGSGLRNSGLMQAGDDLQASLLGGIVNGVNGRMLADRGSLLLRAYFLDNAGVMQAARNLDARVADSLDNKGRLQTMDGSGTLGLEGRSVSNQGTVEAANTASIRSTGTEPDAVIANSNLIQAQGDLELDSAVAINNSSANSRILGNRAVSIDSRSGRTNLINHGRIQAAGMLAVGDGQQQAGKLDNAISGTLLGQDVVIAADRLENAGAIAAGKATVRVASLLNKHAGSSIVTGNGGATFIVAGLLENRGAMHGNGEMMIRAGDIRNSQTGGISASGPLWLSATNNGIANAGALYSGGLLTLGARESIDNSGTMDATDIAATAASFTNTRSIVAADNITIRASREFHNLPVGGMPNLVYTNTRSLHQLSVTNGGSLLDPTVITINQYTDTTTSSLPEGVEVMPGQIVAGKELRLSYGGRAGNKASVLSADNLVVVAEPGAQSFDNSNLQMSRIDAVSIIKVVGHTNTGKAEYFYARNADEAAAGPDKYSGRTSDLDVARQYSAKATVTIPQGPSYDASIRARTLVVDGGNLVNSGNPLPAQPQQISAGGAAAEDMTRTPGQGPVLPPGGGQGLARPASFAGLDLSLPANPNGYFVISRDPGTRYLVETNPRFLLAGGIDSRTGQGGNTADGVISGSDYLAMELGFDPERMQKRLGDAAYEQRLIQQQLIAQTGRHLLAGKRNEAAQMQALFESAADQAKSLGLHFGVALGDEQINALDRDIVWMVEQEVRGEKVLAPVVYLSRASREGVERGTVIAADDIMLQVASLDNRGGVIAGHDKLAVRARNDVRNTSGTIKGGNVDLQSAAGDIVNATLAETSSTPYQTRTVIGKTASIESSGDMHLDAGRNIAVKGAQMQAGGDAILRAGGTLEANTVADHRADATSASIGFITGLDRQGQSGSIATTTHRGSSIRAGGALDATSAGDMRIAGSRVHADGDLLLKAGGDLVVTGRDDTMNIRNSVTTSATGVGGGLRGTQTVIVEKDRSRNLASAISSDGKAVVVADKDVLIKGSSLAARDKLIVAGDTVTVAAARDSDRDSTTVSTVSLLKADASGKASATASADGQASVIDQRRVEALKMADGELVQDVRGGAGTKNETGVSSKRSFATFQMTDAAGKSRTGDRVEKTDTRLALREESDEGARPVSVRSAKGAGGAGTAGPGKSSGEASSRSSAEASASGNASATASASGKAGVKLIEHIVEKDEQSAERLDRSTLSGSDVNLLARQDAMLEAATVRASRDLKLQGRNVRIESGQDKTVTSTTRQVTAAGLLVNSTNTASAQASGSAKADAKVSHLARPQGHDGDANASASVDASVKVAAKSDNKVDLFRSNETTEAVTTIKHAGSDIEAGRRLAVIAGKDMLVEGSALKGKASVDLEASRMNFAAAQDSVARSTSSTDISAGLALLADGNAQASGKAGVSVEAGGKLADRGLLNRDSAQASVAGTAAASASASADARGEAGLQAQYRHATETTKSTTAKVASIVSAGGDVTRTATGEIRDVGTAIDAAGNVSQRATSINSLAARNTTSQQTVSEDHQGRLTAYAKAGAAVAATASAKGAAGAGYLGGNTLAGESESDTVKGTRAGAGLGAQLHYEFAGTDKQAAASTAVVASIKAGGKVSSVSAEATVFEGTQISAAKSVDLAAQRMELKAAADAKGGTDKATSASGKLSAGAGVGTSSKAEGELSGKLEKTENISDSGKARVVGISAGEGLRVRASEDLLLEGASLKAGGDAELTAGGKLGYGAAADTTSSSVAKTAAELAASTGSNENDSKASLALKGSDTRTSSAQSKAVAGKLEAGGSIRIEGAQAATLEGTQLSAKVDVDIGSEGKVTVAAARDVAEEGKRVIGGGIDLGRKQAGNLEKKSSEQSSSTGMQAAGTYEKTHTDTAKTASVAAGGSLRTRSGGDSTFEGATLAAGGKVEMSAGGNLAIDAARDRYTSTTFNGSLKLGVDTGSQTAPDKKTNEAATNQSLGGKANLEAAANHVDKTTSRGGSITAGAAGVALAAGGNASMEGATVKSGGDLAVAAGGDLTIDTARSTTRSAGASLGLGGSDKSNTVRTDKNASAQSLDLAAHSGSKETHGAAKLDARGAVALGSGGKTSLVNTEVKADAGTGIRAASMEKRAVGNTDSTINVGASVSRQAGGAKKKKTDPKAAQAFEKARPAKTGQPSAIRIGERPASAADSDVAAKPADAASRTDATATRPRSGAQAAPRQQDGSSGSR